MPLYQVLEEQRDCLLVWATGSGKTYTMFNIIKRMNKSSIVIVPTLALLVDMIKTLEKMNIEYRALSSIHCRGLDEKIKQTLLIDRPKVISNRITKQMQPKNLSCLEKRHTTI